MNGTLRVRPITAKAPPSGSRLPVGAVGAVHCGQLMSQPLPAGVNQPARSTVRCTLPAALRSSTWPSAPTWASTVPACAWPGTGLRLLAVGTAPPTTFG